MKFLFSILYEAIFVFGFSFSFFFLFGLALDVHGIDQAPRSTADIHVHESDAITFDGGMFERTATGVIKRGLVSNYAIDCISGVLSFKIHGGYSFDYRRLINKDFLKSTFAVHTSREICTAAEFSPAF